MMLCCHFTCIGSTVGVKVGTCLVLDACESFWTPFFMAAFFCITGMCSNFEGGMGQFILKNVKQILLPAFVLGVLTAVLSWALQFFKCPFPISSWKSLVGCASCYWFLNALFLSKVILFCLKKYTGHFLAACCILLYVVGCVLHLYDLVPNVFSFLQALIFLPFLYMGYLIKKRQDLLSSVRCCLLPYPLIFAAACIFGYPMPGAWAIIHISFANILPHLVIVPFGILFLLFIARFCAQCRGWQFAENTVCSSIVSI